MNRSVKHLQMQELQQRVSMTVEDIVDSLTGVENPVVGDVGGALEANGDVLAVVATLGNRR